MAVVNKFNVNKEQVTLDPDIIENMSANDVSYNSSLQYDENTVGDKISKLEKEVIYDVTANNNGAVFESLQSLLSNSNLSTLIPTSGRHGGMSIRFIQSSDNKYVQYRLLTQTFSTNDVNWKSLDSELYGQEYTKFTLNAGIRNDQGVGNQLTLTTGWNTSKCIYKTVRAGEKYKIVGKGGNNYRLYSFTDSELTILSVASSNYTTSADGIVVVAPADGYIVVNLQNDSVNPYFGYYGSINAVENDFYSLKLQDTTEQGSQATQLSLTLGKNKSGDTQPQDVKNINTIILPQATDEKAGLLPAKNQWDAEPIIGSSKLVKSGGVAKVVGQISGYEITGFASDAAITNNQGVGNKLTLTTSWNTSKCIYVSVLKDQVYKIIGAGGSTARLYSFTDTELTILSVANSNYTTPSEGILVTAPSNGYLVVNIQNSSTNTYFGYYGNLNILRKDMEESYSQINTKITYLQDNFTGKNNYPINTYVILSKNIGEVVNINDYRSEPGMNSCVVKTLKNDNFILSGKGGNSYRIWQFIDEDGVVVSTIAATATLSEKQLTAPCDGYLICNFYTDIAFSLEKVSVNDYVDNAISETKNNKFGEFNLTNANDMAEFNISTDREGNYSFKRKIGQSFSFSQKIKLPTDIHSVNETVQLMRVDYDGGWYKVELIKGITSEPTPYYENNLAIRNTGVGPFPKYNASIRVTNDQNKVSSITPDGWSSNIMLGDNPMSIRFKGDCSVVSNQDIRIKCDGTKVEVYHSTNNSIIASYLYADYETMEDLYVAIKADTAEGEALEDFEIYFYILEDLVPSDIIECDVPLVSEYYNFCNTNWPNDNSTFFDAFPFYFTTKDKYSVHTLELLIDQSRTAPLQFVLDGNNLFRETEGKVRNNRTYTFIVNTNAATFGRTRILNYYKGEFPKLKWYYMENVSNGLSSPDGQTTSRKRVATLSALCKKYNYAFGNISDICKMLDGVYNQSQNVDGIMHISHDDTASEVVLNKEIRETYLRNGIYPSVGIQLHLSRLTPEVLKDLNDMKGIGFEYHPHEGMLHYKRSEAYQTFANRGVAFLSYAELEQEVDAQISGMKEKFNEYPIFFNSYLDPINYNAVNYMRSRGYRIIVSRNSNGSLNIITRYACRHLWWFDSEHTFGRYNYIDMY